ncbi:hypothetical protein EWJ76_22915 [Salmonella enterica subsp. enterica serovar Enteritidis]|uniref:Uncharacterized protein n=1 Tax=Salmonella enteritidis TaxID=149539 RepID=A0A5W7YDH0_SALEN|nr:hypothetical protein [Salmonella enterica]EBE3740062.1 hypothetical protein [Salmonella enterica subsp. enterica serovar Heidelberg]EBX9693607.1 hypothetical protein [Salmonella enterica subsp. enterica serovar Enteritidis]ECI0366773.1 hypothetical protein [Salmonella enterica subsp. enterica]OCQ24143.1 hypothetical protein A6I94_23640 [Escherichia coli]CVC84491.1 Uncharacterised protein [Serratia marcescens]
MEIWKSWLMNWNPSIVQFVTYPLQNSSNTVYENSLAIILTMTLSPSAMLLADFLFKKYN